MKSIAAPSSRLNWFALVSYGMFNTAFVLAIVFAKERLFADASYYFFHSINQGYPQVDHDRITLFLAQIVPLIGYYIGIGVKGLIYLHSIGHVLFFFTLFLYLNYSKKRIYHAFAIALLTCTGVTVLFFSPMLEIWYGIALAIWWDAELKDSSNMGLKRYAFLSLLLTFIVLSHPENFGVAIFIFIMNALQKGVSKNNLIWFFSLIIVLLTYKWMTFSEYEAGKINNGFNTDQNQFYSERTSLSYYLQWLHMLLLHYYDCVALILVGFVGYAKTKNYKRLAFVLLSLIGFAVIIHYTSKADEFTRYNESVHLPLVAMSLIVLIDALYLIKRTAIKHVLVVGLMLTFSYRVSSIVDMGNELKQRTELIESFIQKAEKQQLQKGIVSEIDFEGKPGYYKTWSISIESLLLSTMKNPNKTISIITDDDWNHDKNHMLSNGSNFIFRRWEIYHNNWLNLSLFKLPVEDYKFIK